MSPEAPEPTEKEGFVDLFTAAAPALFAWAGMRIHPALRSRLDPDDLVQEVCCRAFANFDHYDSERSPFRSWLFGIANNFLKQALLELNRSPRQKRSSLTDSTTDLIGRIPDEVTSVSRRLSRDENLQALVERAAGLDEDDRRLLLMRGLEGKKHREVAEALKLSVDVVEKRWERLRERIVSSDLPARLLVP